MTHVATLITNPAAPVLSQDLVEAAARSLEAVPVPAWLDEGVAADIRFSPRDGVSAHERLREALGDAPVDIVVQPLAGRRKRLFLADMDSTMIGQECIDELADLVGLKAEVSAITERAMRGELPFEPALRERVALLGGLPVSVVDRIIAERITLTPGGTELVRTMRAQGAYTCLVSGGFTLFTGPIAARIGFHEHRSNLLIEENGTLAGRVEEPILGREAKLATLRELRTRLNLADSDTLAVGDGANDLAMLAEAGLGVAYHAKPAVAAAAHARIDHGDLSALLYLQGYRRDDFVA
ncbi:phosphoserine phosphatase [Chelatococcus sp. CO-6]|nr:MULTISPECIES: phosphoserine phosphatase SerB [unclassified Chelatococcus]ALA19393.1 phosphoserine phosphatase [Chelatococcus sp. CO-6]